jgi:hypothetical protein
MEKVKYEGVIGTYSFLMTSPDVIEVWTDYDNENPFSYIFLKEDTVKSEKDFHAEISYWYMSNVG